MPLCAPAHNAVLSARWRRRLQCPHQPHHRWTHDSASQLLSVPPGAHPTPPGVWARVAHEPLKPTQTQVPHGRTRSSAGSPASRPTPLSGASHHGDLMHIACALQAPRHTLHGRQRRNCKSGMAIGHKRRNPDPSRRWTAQMNHPLGVEMPADVSASLTRSAGWVYGGTGHHPPQDPHVSLRFVARLLPSHACSAAHIVPARADGAG